MGKSNDLRVEWSSSTRRLGSDCFRCPDKHMHFLRENRSGRSKSLHWAHALRIALPIFLPLPTRTLPLCLQSHVFKGLQEPLVREADYTAK
jgi:hypothetical protein